ncbi:MAG: hypothetical protein LBB94_10350 [Clostridiales bacterium]|jgi:hypothetical protein|nr:hypothetical protein [Clostridiales bacterium]
MKKFIPRDKLSKKARCKLDARNRKTWGDLRPVTSVADNKKSYKRTKIRNWTEEPQSGFFLYDYGFDNILQKDTSIFRDVRAGTIRIRRRAVSKQIPAGQTVREAPADLTDAAADESADSELRPVKVLAAALFLFLFTYLAAAAPAGREKLTPNTLIIRWEDGSKPEQIIDVFRIRGYNVAQLRTLTAACGGSVISLDDGSYQIVKTVSGDDSFSSIAINGEIITEVQFDITPVRDPHGNLYTPSQPGWVYLTDYKYNWGGIHDILYVLDMEIVSFADKPDVGQTTVVVREKQAANPAQDRKRAREIAEGPKHFNMGGGFENT